MNRLATRPGARGRGHASALLAELERRLAAKGCRKVNLLIEPDNQPVTGFYQQRGYGEDQLIFMEKWLPPCPGPSGKPPDTGTMVRAVPWRCAIPRRAVPAHRPFPADVC